MSRTLLLVSPAFHGYDGAVAAAFEAAGHDVTTHRYDALPSLGARVRHHARYELPARVGLDRLGPSPVAERTEAAVAAVRECSPDVVVVVKGDQLGEDFWQALDDRRLPRVLWLYDELRRTDWDPTTLRDVGPVASYSAQDVVRLRNDGVAATYLPLAYDHRCLPSPPPPSRDEVVFVGARYPRREDTLLALAQAGVPVRAFGRDWSGHPVDRLRTWSVRRPAVPHGRDLPRAGAYRRMAESAATLNLHGDQDGFTMRTFEACGVGALQLVDRADVAGLLDPRRGSRGVRLDRGAGRPVRACATRPSVGRRPARVGTCPRAGRAHLRPPGPRAGVAVGLRFPSDLDGLAALAADPPPAPAGPVASAPGRCGGAVLGAPHGRAGPVDPGRCRLRARHARDRPARTGPASRAVPRGRAGPARHPRPAPRRGVGHGAVRPRHERAAVAPDRARRGRLPPGRRLRPGGRRPCRGGVRRRPARPADPVRPAAGPRRTPARLQRRRRGVLAQRSRGRAHDRGRVAAALPGPSGAARRRPRRPPGLPRAAPRGRALPPRPGPGRDGLLPGPRRDVPTTPERTRPPLPAPAHALAPTWHPRRAGRSAAGGARRSGRLGLLDRGARGGGPRPARLGRLPRPHRPGCGSSGTVTTCARTAATRRPHPPAPPRSRPSPSPDCWRRRDRRPCASSPRAAARRASPARTSSTAAASP